MNPYHLFLDLPETETAPDYYALLGLPRFADDLRQIHAAALARNTQLRSWDNSSHYREANELLDKVAQASIVLEDAVKKAEYDRLLRESLEPAVDPEPIEDVIALQEAEAVESFEDSTHAVDSEEQQDRRDVGLFALLGWFISGIRQRWNYAADTADPLKLLAGSAGRQLRMGVILSGVTPAIFVLQQNAVYFSLVGGADPGELICFLVAAAPPYAICTWLILRRLIEDGAVAVIGTVGVLFATIGLCVVVRFCGNSPEVQLAAMLIAKVSQLMSALLLAAAFSKFMACAGPLGRMAMSGMAAFALSASLLIVQWTTAVPTILWLPGTEGALLNRRSVMRPALSLIGRLINLEDSVSTQLWITLTWCQMAVLVSAIVGLFVVRSFIRSFRPVLEETDQLASRVAGWGLMASAVLQAGSLVGGLTRFQGGGRGGILTRLGPLHGVITS